MCESRRCSPKWNRRADADRGHRVFPAIEDLDSSSSSCRDARVQRVLSRQDDPEEDGTLRSVIQGYYNPERAAGSSPRV